MYEEDRGKVLGELLELAKENNRLLHKLVNTQRLSTAWSILKWLVIIGISLASYYYLQPYLDQLLKIYTQVGSLPNWPF